MKIENTIDIFIIELVIKVFGIFMFFVQERRKRVDAEIRAQEEIERLRLEIAALNGPPKGGVSACTRVQI